MSDRLKLSEDDLDRIAEILNRHDAGDLGLQGVAEEIFAAFGDDKHAAEQDGVSLIAAERRRQIEVEGWSPEHDDVHSDGSLVMAAVCYAWWDHFELPDDGEKRVPANWPWAASWWKPSTPLRDLVKAGALIAAEIDRLRRKAAQEPAC